MNACRSSLSVQYFYFCTSKVSKLSTCTRVRPLECASQPPLCGLHHSAYATSPPPPQRSSYPTKLQALRLTRRPLRPLLRSRCVAVPLAHTAARRALCMQVLRCQLLRCQHYLCFCTGKEVSYLYFCASKANRLRAPARTLEQHCSLTVSLARRCLCPLSPHRCNRSSCYSTSHTCSQRAERRRRCLLTDTTTRGPRYN